MLPTPVYLQRPGDAVSSLSDMALTVTLPAYAPGPCLFNFLQMPFESITRVEPAHNATVKYDSQQFGNDLVAFSAGRLSAGVTVRITAAVIGTGIDFTPYLYLGEGVV